MSELYFPVEENDYRILLGLQPIREEAWVDVDDLYNEQTALKRDLIRDLGDKVFNVLEGREAPCQEVYDIVKQELSQFYPDLPINELPKHDHPLMRASVIVQEDLVLMQPTPDGYILGAASVCFPTGWNLLEKIGRPMWDIHEDVPGLNEKIGHSVDKFFKNLKPGKKIKRFNWSLYDSTDLFQANWAREEQERPTDITSQNIGDRFTFRVEKQTLQRLSRSEDILFTIRIFNTPLSEICADDKRRTAFLHTINTMPQEMQDYKELTPYIDIIRDYLQT